MKDRYKIILSNKVIYKEIELTQEMQSIKIGTGIECDVRLHKEYFFDNFELTFSYNSNWTVMCSDNIYISVGDVRKLITKELHHGDFFIIRYQESNTEMLNVEFNIDFEHEKKNYDRVIDLSNSTKVKIGGTEDSNIYVDDVYVGSDSISILKKNNEYILCEENTKYGVYVNGLKTIGKTKLNDNDFISLASVSFCLKDNYLFTDARNSIRLSGVNEISIFKKSNKYEYPRFNRSTRTKSVIIDEKIEILDPPTAPQKPTGNIILRLLPAIVMLVVTVVLRGFMSSSNTAYIWISVISMSLGIFTSTVSIVSERRKYKKETKERIEKYNTYIENKKKFITECRNNETALLNDTYFSLKREVEMVNDFSMDLFNRNVADDDYIEIRIGTGSKKAIREINYKKQEKFECNDELVKIPEAISIEYANVNDAPITLDLKQKNAIGIVGERENLYNILKVITVDLSVRQYYSDLKIFYILDEENADKFRWVRMLPHIKNEVLNARNIVCDADSRNILFEYLYKELSYREAEKINYPNIVVFVYNDMGIKRHPISRYVDKASSVGVTFIFFEEYRELLPMGCSDIVILKDSNYGEIISADNNTNCIEFSYEILSDRDAEIIVNKLAPIYCEEVSLEGSLTKKITLYELLKIMNVEDIDLDKNWSESQVYETMAAPLGVKSKNEMVFLDLNEKKHGPHGLVAGTTGSGKSEILQSYILSMATLFHPYDVGFVIIDFKGGGMVNQFKNLPHLIGAITNIDGREINRSLLSIKAELRKRQELFAQYEVNHIDAYIKLYKKGATNIPLPHLILIVDEFAELKMDQPEFMKELISAARIGRSLGVHLILATQKPSGVVDAQIWSNSKFKLCLKVQNKEDSNEVLKTPVAAEIKEPGRAYLQVGNNEIFELFQSAYSGAPASYDDTLQQKAFTISSVDLSGRHTPVFVKKVEKANDEKETQLIAISNYISRYCECKGIVKLPGICLPPLLESIDFSKASQIHNETYTIIPLGIYDDPDNQYQGEATLNLLTGNTAIIGSSQYGKTNLLQLIIRSIAVNYTPKEVNLYVLDFASMALNVFNKLNHIGGVILASEDEKIKNFMRMIRNEIKERKEIFSKLGITSFASYKEAGKNDIPHIVIMVDNFLALKELYPDYEEDIINICREGVSIGISLVITSIQTNGISYKYMSNFAHRICFYCNQGDEYGSLFDKCRMSPKNVPGRSLYEINKVIYELQTYLAFEGNKEIERVEKIKEFILEVNEKYGNNTARKIPEVPQILDMRYIEENCKDFGKYKVPIGIDYDSVEFVALDLLKAVTVGITGRDGFGKTNFARLLIQYLHNNIFEFESKVYILDDYEKQFDIVSDYGIVERYTIDVLDFESILTDIEEELQYRLNKVKESGMESLEDEPLLMFVIQNNDIFAADGISKNAVDTYKRILKTYRNMKILFVFANIENAPIAYGATEMLKTIKDINCLLVMEDLANLKLMDINAATVRQYKKPISIGDAYMITEKEIRKNKIIHL